MNTQQFLKMNEEDRVNLVNKMLCEENVNTISHVAAEIGLSSASLSKKITEDGKYVYSRRMKQYIPRSGEPGHLKKDDAIHFILGNLEQLKKMVEREKELKTSSMLVLSPEVVGKSDEYIVRNTKIPSSISEEFMKLSEDKFSFLRLQDLYAQALWDFVMKYR